MAKVLSAAQVEEIHRLREVVDDWGTPVHSGEDIADALGVSSSTIWRVLKGKAAYKLAKTGNGQVEARFRAMERDALKAADQPRPDLEAAAEASAKKMLAALERQGAAKELTSPEAQARAKAYGAFDSDELGA